MQLITQVFDPWAVDMSRNVIYMLTLVFPQAISGLISIILAGWGIKKFRAILHI